MNDPHSNARRRLLERSALVVGGLLVAPAFVTAKEKERRLGANASTVFTSTQRELVRSLCDTILPETDTAGALGAHVDDFISDTLELWCTPLERRAFLTGLDAFAQSCRAGLGIEFTALSTADRLAYLEPLDRDAVEARNKRVDPLPFFATVKELTLIGYYTSEAGCKAIGYVGPMGTLPGPDGPLNSPVWI
jgi:gluconate 2-dehydrogenase gamma chain